MNITIADSSNLTIPGTTKVTIKDALVLLQGGEKVVQLDAEYDLKDVPPAYHEILVNLMMTQRVRLLMPTAEALEESDRRVERYRQQKAEYGALPWWKKMFSKRSWLDD